MKNNYLEKSIDPSFYILVLIVLGLITLFLVPICDAQELPTPIYYDNFNTGGVAKPYITAPVTLDPHLTFTQWTTSMAAFTNTAGNTAAYDGEIAGSKSLSGTAPSGTTLTLALNVNAGYHMSVTNYSLWGQYSATGPNAWSITINGINIGSGTFGIVGTASSEFQPDFSVANQVNNLTGAITIVLTVAGGSGGTFRMDDFTLYGSVTSVCVPPAAPTISASAMSFANVQCYQTDVSFTAGNGSNRIVVAKAGSAPTGTSVNQTVYNANSVFGAGDILNAGEYVVYNGNGNSFTVKGLLSNTAYYFKVYEYNTASSCPAYKTTAPLSANQTTLNSCGSPACPYVESILINSCANSSYEGVDEYCVIQNGGATLDITNPNFTIAPPGGSPTGRTFCYTCTPYTIGNNPYYISQQNAACPGLLVYSTSIPPNATIMAFMGNPPSALTNFNPATICATATKPIYALFLGNNSTTGNFDNSGSAVPRTLTSSYSTACGSVSVNYIPNSTSNADGDYTTYSSAGGAPVTYGNNGNCVAPLPIELLLFTGTYNNPEKVNLFWSTASEQNNDYFNIERSVDAINYTAIGAVQGTGNSSTLRNYSFTDNQLETLNLKSGTIYYRLKQTDFNGEFKYYGSVAVELKPTDGIVIYPNPASNVLFVGNIKKGNIPCKITILNLIGEKVYEKAIDSENEKEISLSEFPRGVYMFKFSSEQNVLSRKLVIK